MSFAIQAHCLTDFFVLYMGIKDENILFTKRKQRDYSGRF